MACEHCPHCIELARLATYEVTAAAILSAISERFQIPEWRITSPQRAQHLTMVRQVGMYLTRKLTKLTYSAIGEFYHRDHSTVVHAWNLIAARQLERPMFGQQVVSLEQLILAGRPERAAA